MEQLNIFGMLYPEYKIDKKVKLIELFAGVGSQAMAIRDLGIEFEHHKVVEFDKYAIKSYNAIHHTNFNTTDIRDVHCDDLEIFDKDKFTYLLTYSFPCQDLSKAGKQKGMSKGSGTRSGLLWEVERILNECQSKNCLPQILLMENVPDVISVKNYDDFMMWYNALEKMGYQSYYKVMNAKNYGIPQNRERCFMVSILGDYNYTFPEEEPLTVKLRDLLDDCVDEKYFISDSQVEKIKKSTYNTTQRRIQTKDISDTLCARDYKDPKCVQVSVKRVGGIYDKDGKKRQAGSVYDTDGLSPTLDTSCGGYHEPCVIIPENTKKGYAVAHEGDGIYLNRPHLKRGCVQKDMIQTLKTSANDLGVVVENKKTKLCNTLIEKGLVKEYDVIRHSYSERRMNEWDKRNVESNNMSPTLDTRCDCLGVAVDHPLRIRKLTPKECWRLMGFSDEDFELAKAHNSDSQLYKQAGNSIVKNVLMAIFKQMI